MSYKIFWLDDDLPHRLKRTRELLEKQGWTVSFFNNLDDFEKENGAIHTLANEPFDLILLDQEIQSTNSSDPYGDLWIGCTIFYWLRDQTAAPNYASQAAKTLFNQLKKIQIKIKKTDIPVFFITAYDNDGIKQAIKNCEGTNTGYIDKPIDRKLLIDSIKNKLRRK